METKKIPYNAYLRELASRAGLTYFDIHKLTGIPATTVGKYLNLKMNASIPVERYDLIETACKDRIKENQKFINASVR